MAPELPSNIRVFVKWHDQTVFAGEEIKCTITFKNVSPTSNQQKHQQSPSLGQSNRLASSLHGTGRAKANASLAAAPPITSTNRGHRKSALSFSGPPSSSRTRSGSLPWNQAAGPTERRPSHAHKRSVSIVSIGSNSTVEDINQRNEAPSRPQRPQRGHGRASSLQIVPRNQPPTPGSSHSATFPRHTSSPLFNASYPPDRFGRRSGPPSASNSPIIGGPRGSPRVSSNNMPEFRFPATAPPTSESPPSPKRAPIDGLLSPTTKPTEQFGNLPTRSKDQSNDKPLTSARILSSTSVAGGTPRSSGEFYTVSNNSSETLASEYVSSQPVRHNARPAHLRRSSGLIAKSKAPESLMMGYAQIQGSFILDGSLVSLSQFEQVKKKAVVGGRGGGVVGLESSRRESGLLRGFGWNNISTSIGDLLGGSELSTIREMRGVANSKSVPLLSTPQSILFVDLHLAPGESKVFEYSFQLPKGLPPTHRGKAIKISYGLVIGTQRPGGAKEQQVRSVEIPFRVLGSVNSYGEVLGHDLMSPYIILRDEAQVKAAGKSSKIHRVKVSHGAPATMGEFLGYVDNLVTRRKGEANGSLLSPTEGANSRRPSTFEEATTAKEAIRLAIMRSNLAGDGQQSPNRFEIARNGQRVGVVMLTRPAYRLGEVVTMGIDFTDADIRCYAVHATLETSERVESSLALRSESSIQRVTRKVYVSSSEATLYTRRIVFTPTIPISASPEFVTSGVNLEWKIRVEFVVPAAVQQHAGGSSNSLDEANEEASVQPAPAPTHHQLLEQISQDDKGGLVLVAAENLACESFDIAVPLRVYGAVGTGLERLERDEASEEGIAV